MDGPRSEKLPPASIEAEMVVLSALMIAGDPNTPAFAETMAVLSGREVFHVEDNALIFDAIAACAARGQVDGVLVRLEMERRGTFELAGGYDYLGAVLNSAPTAAHGPGYALEVADKHRLRQLLTLAREIETRCYQPTTTAEPATVIGADAAGKLARIVTSGAAVASETVGDIVIRVVDDMGKEEAGSVKTGIADFDARTGGIYFGEEVILAARPSMGKSALAKQIAYQVAAAGTPVALISQEESKAKIVRNLISSITGIDNNVLRKPKSLTPNQWAQVMDAQADLARLPLIINDTARSLRDVRAAAAALVARHGCKLLIIDYLQRINAPGASRYEQVTSISQGISDLVKELGVAGLVLAQLSRGAANREDRRPTMTDLRESGQIEQDADGIVFLHREDYYHLDDKQYVPNGEAELIIAKWRDGVRGGRPVVLKSNLKHQRFENIEPKPGEDPWEQ